MIIERRDTWLAPLLLDPGLGTGLGTCGPGTGGAGVGGAGPGEGDGRVGNGGLGGPGGRGVVPLDGEPKKKVSQGSDGKFDTRLGASPFYIPSFFFCFFSN